MHGGICGLDQGVTRSDYPHWYLRLFKWWAIGFGAIAGLIAILALADLTGVTQFGYPWFVAPVCFVGGWVALRVYRRAAADLRSLDE